MAAFADNNAKSPPLFKPCLASFLNALDVGFSALAADLPNFLVAFLIPNLFNKPFPRRLPIITCVCVNVTTS